MKKMITVFLLMFLVFQCFAPNGDKCLFILESEPLHPFKMQDPILRSVACQETEIDPYLINEVEDAGGLLQIRQIMIEEVNRICKKLGLPDRFVLADRMNPVKAIRIWWIVQNYLNPVYDLKEACLIWNGRGKGNEEYYKSVKNIWIKQR